MKILLTAINAKYIHSNLAVYSLKAYGNDVADIEIQNFTINNQKENIIRDIYNAKADVVAFSVYIWNVEYVKAIAKEIKKLIPDVKIWLGGPEVSYLPEEFLKENKWADVIMILEGEETFKELAIGKSLDQITGIAYRDGDIIMRNPDRPLLDMDELVFPYGDLKEFENRIIYYESSRGCPFSCSYCLSSVEKSVRFRSTAKVKEELAFFIKNKIPQVKFVDRTFNCNHNRTKELWQYILENDNGVTNFHFEVSADLLDEEEIHLIENMRPGLIQLEIGVQSTNDDTIREIRRTMNLSKLNNIVEKIRSFNNTHQHLDLIAGLPFEDYDTFIKSFNQVYGLKPQQLQLGFLKVLKGSYMYEKSEDYELKYTDYPPYEVMQTKWISYDEMLRLKHIEDMVENYYNSGQYGYTMNYLERFFENPFEMYEKLAMFYTENKLWDINHSRIMRYNYLYEFAVLIGADKEAVAQIMTFDLYLREKLKKRPEFAINISEYKECIRNLYEDEFAEYKDKYTHIEPMTIDPDSGMKTNLKYVLFDYESKDKLNNYAKVIYYEEGKTEQNITTA